MEAFAIDTSTSSHSPPSKRRALTASQSSGAKGLRLVRDDDSPAVKHAHSSTTHVDQPCIYEDDDEEALAAPQAKLAFQTFFDIIHSPTYGVPVLYVYSKTVSSPIGSESDDQEHLPYMGKDSAIPHPQPRAYLSMTVSRPAFGYTASCPPLHLQTD